MIAAQLLEIIVIDEPDADPRRAQARLLWPDNNLTIKAIAERVGAARSTIGRWAKAEGWTGRVIETPRPRFRTIGLNNRAAARQPRKSNVRRHLVTRLYRILNHNVQVMENRMSDDNASGTNDPERDMRALGNAVRSAEKLKELETDNPKRDNAPVGGRAVITPEEEDRIRRQVIDGFIKIRERKRRERGDIPD